jgi:hypothetical protein
VEREHVVPRDPVVVARARGRRRRLGAGGRGHPRSDLEWDRCEGADPALLAPFVCGRAAFTATRVACRVARSVHPASTGRGFRGSQILSSGLVALAHGTNDAQKTMGVKMICASAVALGTFSGGGGG